MTPQPSSAIMRMDWSRISRQWQSAEKTSPAVQRVWTRTRTGCGQVGRGFVGSGAPNGCAFPPGPQMRGISTPWTRTCSWGPRSGRPVFRHVVSPGDFGSGSAVEGMAVRAEVAADEGDVAFAALDLAFVGDHAEFAVAGLDAGLAGANDGALVAEAVADELGDGEDAEAVLAAERDEVGDAGHGAVVAHDFADDAGGGEAGEAGEIDGGFGLAGADKDAAAAGAEREDVAGTDEVGGGGAGVDGDLDGVGAVGGGNSCRHAFASFDGLRECGAEAGGVLLGHGRQAQVVGAVFCQRKADEAAAVAGHEVDGLGGDVLGGQGEIALVLAVLIVDHDDHAAGLDIGDGAGDVGEGRVGSAGGLGHVLELFSLIGGGNARSGRVEDRGVPPSPQKQRRGEGGAPGCYRIVEGGRFGVARSHPKRKGRV